MGDIFEDDDWLKQAEKDYKKEKKEEEIEAAKPKSITLEELITKETYVDTDEPIPEIPAQPLLSESIQENDPENLNVMFEEQSDIMMVRTSQGAWMPLPTEYRFSEELKRRIKKNKNALVCITGSTGSGKSYAAMRIALDTDPSFNIDRVVYSVEDFMALLNSGTLKKGNVILLDESGVLVPSREWYSIANRVLNYVLQTFRQDNLIVIFCVPDQSFIDSQTRKLFHYMLEPRTIDQVSRVAKLKVFRIITDPKDGKIYYKYPVFYEGTEAKTINFIACKKPPVALINQYEKKKLDYRRRLGDSITADINYSIIKRQRGQRFNITPLIDAVVNNRTKYEKNYSGRNYIDVRKLMKEFRLNRPNADLLKTAAEDFLYSGASGV